MRSVWIVVLPPACEPSPQVIVYVQGASLPGSLNAARRPNALPGVIDQSEPAFTTGGRFATVTAVVAGALAAPFESVTVSFTV